VPEWYNPAGWTAILVKQDSHLLVRFPRWCVGLVSDAQVENLPHGLQRAAAVSPVDPRTGLRRRGELRLSALFHKFVQGMLAR
jgi:hypothetical protein